MSLQSEMVLLKCFFYIISACSPNIEDIEIFISREADHYKVVGFFLAFVYMFVFILQFLFISSITSTHPPGPTLAGFFLPDSPPFASRPHAFHYPLFCSLKIFSFLQSCLSTSMSHKHILYTCTDSETNLDSA